MKVGDSKNCKMYDLDSINPNCKTLTPVTFFLKIFALKSNVEREKEKPLSSYTRLILMGTLMGSLSFYTLYYKIRYISSLLTASVRITDYVQNIFDYGQYVVDLLYVHVFGRRYFPEYAMQYVAIDKILGTSFCVEIKKKLTKLVTFLIFIWLATSVLDLAAWVTSSYGWITPSVFAVTYIYFLIKILNNLDLTSQTMHIEVRLRIIGDLLQSFYTSTGTQPGLTSDPLQNQNWFYTTTELRFKEIETLRSCDTTDCHEIKWLSRSYLLLTEQCEFINRMFGIRILLNCLSLLIDMVRFTNLAVRLLNGSQNILHTESPYQYLLPFVSTMSRLGACMLILTSLVSHCQKVYRQNDRIISITDHILLNKKPDADMREAVVELRSLVQQRPLSFHLANFLRLDFSMLLSTTSVVVTYTIILLQSVN